MAQRDALQQARLLSNRLHRLDSRRRNQRDAADNAFRADLLTIWGQRPPWLRAMVIQALAQDQTNAWLHASLREAELALDPTERQAPEPAPLELTTGGEHPMAPTDLGGVEVVYRARCEQCDPSFGCFDGSAPCCKVPPPVVMPPPPVMPSFPQRVRLTPQVGGEELPRPAAEPLAVIDVQAAQGVWDTVGKFHPGRRYPEPGEDCELLDDGLTAVARLP